MVVCGIGCLFLYSKTYINYMDHRDDNKEYINDGNQARQSIYTKRI